MCMSVETCCFCSGLEVGAKIVAVAHVVISSLIATVYGSVAITLSYLPSSRLIFYGLVSAAAVGKLVLSCLMAYGAFKGRPRFIWPWTVIAWFASVILVAMSILGTVLLTFTKDNNSYSEISTMVSAYFIYAVVLYYSASVMNSRLEMVRAIQNEAAVQLMRETHVPKSLLVYEDVV